MSLTDLRQELRNAALPPQAAEAKLLVEGYLVRMCDLLAIAQRDPDKWEVNQTLAAIAALEAGWFTLAAVCVEHALAPADERAEEWREPKSAVTRQQLEHAIWRSQRRPAEAD